MFKLRRRLMKIHGEACVVRIGAALHYFKTHIQRMEYSPFRKLGYFIGSGAMEGTRQSPVTPRTDLAGQRGHLAGSLNVLRIRALIADQFHDKYRGATRLHPKRRGRLLFRRSSRLVPFPSFTPRQNSVAQIIA